MELKLLCGVHKDASSKRKFPLRKPLMQMRLLVLLTVVASLQARSNAQSQTITLSVKNTSLEKVFKEIRRQTDYTFIYTNEVLSDAHPVSVRVKDADIEQVLSICFKDQPLSYTIAEKQVIVRTKKEQVTIAVPATEASLIEVRGRVFNQEEEPAEGVSVIVKGTKNGTTTDANGYFALENVDENAVLVFTGVNVESYELNLNGKTDLGSLYLKTKISKLDEVQIIGYGTSTQRYNVGSVTKITGEEIAQQPVANPLEALQGRAAGVSITSTNGVPGSAVIIQIRGQNSLTSTPNPLLPALSTPLFIIDGVPFAPQNANLNQSFSIAAPVGTGLYNSGYSGISPFNMINPADIESVEILRDADATAIYGSRGANGVVLITTKKAAPGKSKFNTTVYTGVSSMPRTMRMMNTQEYLDMRREAFKNDNSTPTASNAPDLFLFDTTKYTNWNEFFFGGNASTLDVNTSLSGGEKNTQYFIGAGFHRETYIFPGDFDDKRVSVNSSLSHRSTNKKFVLTLSTSYSFYKTNSIGTPNLLSVALLEPNYPDLHDSQGNLTWNYNGVNLGTGNGPAANPSSYLKMKYEMSNYNLLSNLHLDYSILPGLTIRSSFGYNTLNSSEYTGSPRASFSPLLNQVASASFGSSVMRSWIVEPQIEYNKTFRNTRIDFLLGSSFQENSNYSTAISASGYNNDDLIGSVSAAPNKSAFDASSRYKYDAFFGRLNILHKLKYILSLSGRRDGSSRFGASKQFGNFGAAGAGWLFSEERFIKRSLSFISYGKLRLSYGLTGSDAIGDYQYIARWAPTTNTYLGSLGYLPQNLANPNFSWGTTKKFEAGFELGVFADRVLINVAWYPNRSGNQLISYPLPSQTGFSNVIENWNALVENRGVELQVQARVVKNKNIVWNVSANLTLPKKKLLSFPNIENSPYSSQYIIGQSLRVINALRNGGVNDTTGYYQFWTTSKQLTYSPDLINDKTVIGDRDPKFFGGIGNTLTIKGLTFSIFFEFKKQTGLNYLSQVYYAGKPGMEINEPALFLSRWQKPGDQTEFPRFTSVSFSGVASTISRFVLSDGVYSDASYVRCKTVSLSYRLPFKYTKKIKMQDGSLYLNCQNLFTVTNYKGNDPETQNFYGIPPLRTIAIGTQLSF